MRNINAIPRIFSGIGIGTRILVTLSAFLVFAFATPVNASIGEGNGELGFDFGFTEFDSNTSNETGSRFVFRGGYHFTDHLQLEVQLAASEADENVVDTTLSTFFINAVFNFHPRENIVPYLLGGIGIVNLEFETPLFTVDDEASAFQVAFGSRFFFGANKKAAFRVELSIITEDTFGDNRTHENLVGGFTWRLGASP